MAKRKGSIARSLHKKAAKGKSGSKLARDKARRSLATFWRRRLPNPGEIELEIDKRIKNHKAMRPAKRRRPSPRALASSGGGPLNIIAHGDSWFDYPVGDDDFNFDDDDKR